MCLPKAFETPPRSPPLALLLPLSPPPPPPRWRDEEAAQQAASICCCWRCPGRPVLRLRAAATRGDPRRCRTAHLQQRRERECMGPHQRARMLDSAHELMQHRVRARKAGGMYHWYRMAPAHRELIDGRACIMMWLRGGWGPADGWRSEKGFFGTLAVRASFLTSERMQKGLQHRLGRRCLSMMRGRAADSSRAKCR